MYSMDEFDVIDIQPELEIILKAIAKAVGSDMREFMAENQMPTYNSLPYVRVDKMNKNLRNMLVTCDETDVQLFKRSSWTGSLLIDRKHLLTITICARDTWLRNRRKKDRQSPHYLQTFGHILNGDLKSEYSQMTIGDFLDDFEEGQVFDEEVYEADFEKIVEGAIEQGEGYRHCLVTYEAEKFELKSADIMILDECLNPVHDIPILYLYKPDYGNLSAPVDKSEEEPVKKDAHSLVKVKGDLKSKYSTEPEKQAEISTKKQEVAKMA